MMTELQQRDITMPAAQEKFLDGLGTLAQAFDGSESLAQAIAEARQEFNDRP